MAEIVAGIAASHAPFVAMHPQFEQAPAAQGERVIKAFTAARELLERAAPDVIVIFSNDHLDRFFFDNLPAFLIGIGEEAKGPINEWIRLPKVKVRIHSRLGRFLVEEGFKAGIDFARSEELPLDHSECVPLHFLTPQWNLPIVPVVVNTFASPMPTLKRCCQVGEFVRRAVEKWPGRERVAFVGSGGLSHWVGIPGTGKIGEEFDRWFLDRLMQGRLEEISETYGDEKKLEAEAGNGGQEVRDWLSVAAAMPPEFQGRVLAYEPIPPWLTGFGVAVWSL